MILRQDWKHSPASSSDFVEGKGSWEENGFYSRQAGEWKCARSSIFGNKLRPKPQRKNLSREGGTRVQLASWKVCGSQMCLFLVIKATRVWTASPACFFLRGDCLHGPHPLAVGSMTSLGFPLTTCRGVCRPWKSTFRKHYFSSLESLIMGYKCRNAELFYIWQKCPKQDRAAPTCWMLMHMQKAK